MKVLWFTNSLLPDHARILNRDRSHRGGWMSALADALAADDRLELAVATNVADGAAVQQTVRGVLYYTIPARGGNDQGRRLPGSLVQAYQQVLDAYAPDIIHIHGTEYYHGHLTKNGRVRCPVVISLQGIIDVCRRHWQGGLSRDVWRANRTLRDRIRRDGAREQEKKLAARAALERDIITGHPNFIGRTQWDRAQLHRLNPDARYFHCDELLRAPFYETAWKREAVQRHTLLVSGANYPLKGFHILLEAMAILRREFPRLSVRVLNSQMYPHLSGIRRFWMDCRSRGYSRYLSDLIRKKNLSDCTVALPPLDAREVAEEMKRAHAFVLPSLMENSSNSLAEAMMVGTPSVVSYVGGIPSLACADESALMFPPGDEAMLADQIRRLFLDDQLALDLSEKAAAVARRRHARDRIVNDMVRIYQRLTGNDSVVATDSVRLEAALL